MIIRARPKYFKLKRNEGSCFNGDELFFSSGRSALKFVVSEYSKSYHATPTVLIQSFNCQVVLDACLEAGAKVILVDIKLDDFSISYEQLRQLDQVPDIVLLTHYQGVPNNEYQKIAKYCHDKGVFLIEDLAQANGSKVNGVEIGSLGNVVINSFAIDKPFTSFEGGGLGLINLKTSFEIELKQKYESLSQESDRKEKTDLEKLNLFFLVSDATQYSRSLINFNSMGFLLELRLPIKCIISFIHFKRSYLLFNKLFRVGNYLLQKKRSISILKLGNIKVSEVLSQRSSYLYDNAEVDALELYLLKHGFQVQQRLGSDIHWNRYSVLDSTGMLAELLNSEGVEAGEFNWPKPLHKTNKMSESLFWEEELKNSEFASQHIVNIPVWSDFFRKKVDVDDEG
ncbi:MAG: hypothetical protein AXW17_11915 [Colwellia sp. Phe_37]|nr:MAG: hypothetical protein AXW17_11915 [Colwellia sp. Phe_37]